MYENSNEHTDSFWREKKTQTSRHLGLNLDNASPSLLKFHANAVFWPIARHPSPASAFGNNNASCDWAQNIFEEHFRDSNELCSQHFHLTWDHSNIYETWLRDLFAETLLQSKPCSSKGSSDDLLASPNTSDDSSEETCTFSPRRSMRQRRPEVRQSSTEESKTTPT